MLEFEIEVKPELAGDLAARIMSIYREQEVRTKDHLVSFRIPLDDSIDARLGLLEEVLRKFENVRGVAGLDVRSRNLFGPDSGPEVIESGRFVFLQPGIQFNAGPDQIVITLETGCAFGTGGHDSTRLSLYAMEAYFDSPPGAPSRRGAKVLDVGCGTGILSIAAAKLGAGHVTAVDPMAEAVILTLENWESNHVDCKLDCMELTADKVQGEYDLILANLTPAVMTRSVKFFKPLLAEEGMIIAAGFADGHTPGLLKAVTKVGLTTAKSYSGNGWCALALEAG